MKDLIQGAGTHGLIHITSCSLFLGQTGCDLFRKGLFLDFSQAYFSSFQLAPEPHRFSLEK